PSGPGGPNRPGRGARSDHAQGGENVTEVARVPEVGPLAALAAPVQSFPFDLDPAPVRGLVRVRARSAGLAAHRVVDLVLAVGEATANTVRHAGGRGTLRIWQDDVEIVCEVSDPGRLKDPRAGPF